MGDDTIFIHVGFSNDVDLVGKEDAIRTVLKDAKERITKILQVPLSQADTQAR